MNWVVGLDTLRLFAIAMVVVYHFFRAALPGGFLAIEIFLAISGYLLGARLLHAYKKSKNLQGGKFVLRRIARLWPALFICVAATLSLALFSPHGVLEGLHLDALFALLFSTNIQEIVQGGSYEDLTMPNLFEHCWFLALEFQLCLSLPIVLSLATLRARSFNKVLKRTLVLSASIALLSAVLMYVYAGIFGEENRAYFALDTQAFAFYGGVALAAWR
jgi:peptidoglycan/LPS O-acetylase OafA/YrhL